jgi:hypothetical protein
VVRSAVEPFKHTAHRKQRRTGWKEPSRQERSRTVLAVECVGDGATRAALLTRIGPKRVAVEKKDSIGSEEGGDDARGATLVALKMGKLHANPSLANSTHHDRVSIRFERLRGMGS